MAAPTGAPQTPPSSAPQRDAPNASRPPLDSHLEETPARERVTCRRQAPAPAGRTRDGSTAARARIALRARLNLHSALVSTDAAAPRARHRAVRHREPGHQTSLSQTSRPRKAASRAIANRRPRRGAAAREPHRNRRAVRAAVEPERRRSSEEPACRTRPRHPAAERTSRRRRRLPKAPPVARDIKLGALRRRSKVEVRLVERAGEVHFAVRTPDGRLAGRLARATAVALLAAGAERFSRRRLACRGRHGGPERRLDVALGRQQLRRGATTAGSGTAARSDASRTSPGRATPKRSADTKEKGTTIRMAILLPPLTSESSDATRRRRRTAAEARWTRTCS